MRFPRSIRALFAFPSALLLGGLLASCTTLFDKQANRSDKPENRRVAMAAIPAGHRDFHQRLFIADQHADSLLWGRDLLVRNDHGHVDVPRLVEGNVTLQIFGVPTERPFRVGRRPVGNSIGVLSFIQSGQVPSNFDRALNAADRLDEIVEQTAGTANPVRYIKTKADLLRLRSEFEPGARGARPIGVFLGLEGSGGLWDRSGEAEDFGVEDARRNLRVLAGRGFRSASLAHLRSTRSAGAAQDPRGAGRGLTELGLAILIEMERLGMAVDLVHLSPQAIEDVLAAWCAGELSKPMISSHSGVQPYMSQARATSDRHLAGIAMTGGIIGIAYFKSGVELMTVEEIARSFRYVVDVLDRAGFNGIDHVGFGSDFDGTMKLPFDSSELMLLTHELRKPDYGFSDADLRKIAGGNLVRVLLETLPD